MQIIKIISLLIALIMNRLVYAIDIDADGELDKEIQRLQEEKKLWIETVSKQKENKDSAAGIVTVITENDIKRYGGNSLFEVLNRVTSMYMTGSHIWANNNAAMRGDLSSLTNNHTLVLLNGRPLRDNLQGGLNQMVFQNFPIHQIEQIEVVRGSGSVLYGTNAMTGVINIITKKKKDTALTVRGRYGSFNTGQTEGEFAWKNAEASITGAGRFRDTRGRLITATDELNLPIAYHDKAQDVSATVSADWQDFTVNAYFSDADDIHWNGVPIGNGTSYANNRVFADIGHQLQINPHWSVQSNLTYNHTGLHIPSEMVHASEDNLLFEQTHFFNFFDKRLNFSLGGLTEWQSGGAAYPGLVSVTPYAMLKSSVYGEANYAILDNLKLTLGGQWHRNESLQEKINGVRSKPTNGLVGRLGLVYEMTSTMGIKLLYNQAYRSPSVVERMVNVPGIIIGNQDLQPEGSETIDAQFFYHTLNYSASLTAFRTRQSNLSVPTYDATQATLKYVNASSAVFQGLELETKAQLFGTLHWTGAYTFQTNRDGNGQNNASFVPNHIAKLGLSYDVTPQLQLSVFDTFFSNAKKYPTAAQVNPPADSYHNVTLNGNYQLDKLLGAHFAKHMTFSLYVDNLLNEAIYYPEFNRKIINAIPATGGRSVFGEIAIEF